MTCNSCLTLAIIFFSDSCIHDLNWHSWVDFCWTVVAVFLAWVVKRVSYLVSNRLIALPLIALSIPLLSKIFPPNSASLWCAICPTLCKDSFSVFVYVAIVSGAMHTSGPSLVIVSSTSIKTQSWPDIILEIMFTIPQNDIPIRFDTPYIIKNPVCYIRIYFY